MFDRPGVLAWLATHSCPGVVCHTDAQAVHEAAHSLESGATGFCWLQLWGLAEVHEDSPAVKQPCCLDLTRNIHAVCLNQCMLATSSMADRVSDTWLAVKLVQKLLQESLQANS